ncbi:MAG: SAM-dependent methyltransferase [Thermogutta sp.]|nr:SAM-dependent methyltransferase [Thermogutta sp.]
MPESTTSSTRSSPIDRSEAGWEELARGALADWPDYELLDFGEGRRLERFGPWITDRPAAAAAQPKADPARWSLAHARYEGSRGGEGVWRRHEALPDAWNVAWRGLRFELKLSPSGQVGLFPEHAADWAVTQSLLRSAAGKRILNLFAYTGGATLAAAQAGAEVSHVDAARNMVAWAARNAELSGLRRAAVHWIVEDAGKFVRRELRRGNAYFGILLDPPSYGHGPRGESFQFARHISALLQGCLDLLDDEGFLLFTSHTPGFGPRRLTGLLHDLRPRLWQTGRVRVKTLEIPAATGRALPCGTLVAWWSDRCEERLSPRSVDP